MGKLLESTFITLDGVLAAPHEWGMPYWDDEHNAYNAKLFARAEALLLGRETYEGFAAAWSERTGDPVADQMNAIGKYVASRTLTEANWNAEIIDGDVAETVAKLKAGSDGDLLKYGTGELDRTLLAHGLLDELHLWVFPVIHGSGSRILDGLIDPTHFDLADSTVFDSGIVVHMLTPREQPPAMAW